jgi:hypothetical protein
MSDLKQKVLFDEPKGVKLYTVRTRIGWLPGSIALSPEAKAAIAAARDCDPKSIRGSYQILGSSRNPLIKEGREIRSVLSSVIEQYTIPEYAAMAATDNKVLFQKSPGSRVIEESAIPEFLKRFFEILDVYLNWGKRLSIESNYYQLLEDDRKSLGKDWYLIGNRYPSPDALSNAISCEEPVFLPFQTQIGIEQIAPEVFEKLKQSMLDRVNATLNGATSELLLSLREAVAQVAKSLGRKTRLAGNEKHPELKNAEVVSVITHTENPDIPENSLYVTLFPASEDGKRTGKEISKIFTEEEYQGLKPWETTENRKITEAGFKNLNFVIERIKNVKEALDPDSSESLTEFSDAVAQILGRVGSSVEETANTLKKNSVIRQNLHNELSNLAQTILVKETETSTNQKRKIRSFAE